VNIPNRGETSHFLRQLLTPQRASALRAIVDGAIVTVTLARRGVRPLLEGGHPPGASEDPQRAAEVAAAVEAGFKMLPVAPTCLRRSVTLTRELDRLGLASAIHIGVQSIAGEVQAHAWVQAGDLVLNDSVDVADGYVVLAAGDIERSLPLLR